MLVPLVLLLAVARPPEVQALADAALTAPPELAADALIRLAESPAVADREWKLDLLERAFQLSAAARYPLRKTPAAPAAYKAESIAGMLAAGLDLSFSTLDLQARAVQAVLRIDHTRAVDLFLRIPTPRPAQLTCQDALKDRIDRYYDVLADLFEAAFNEKDRSKGKDIIFITPYVSGISSAAQIEPVARMLGRVRATGPDYCALVNGYAGAVSHISADPRSFSAFTNGNMIEPYLELANRCARYGCTAVPMLQAMRAYIGSHAAGARCSDANDEQLKNSAAVFNRGVKALTDPANREVPPLTDDEIKASQVKAAADVAGVSNSTFHERAKNYRTMLDSTPPGTERDGVLSGFVALLRDSPIMRENPPEWYLHFDRLRKMPGAAIEIRRSGNSVMQLYVDLDRVLSASPAQTSTRPR